MTTDDRDEFTEPPEARHVPPFDITAYKHGGYVTISNELLSGGPVVRPMSATTAHEALASHAMRRRRWNRAQRRTLAEAITFLDNLGYPPRSLAKRARISTWRVCWILAFHRPKQYRCEPPSTSTR